MTSLVNYRLWCTTDSSYEYVWQDSEAGAPTTCPTDTQHTIDTDQTSIIETLSSPKQREDGVQYTVPKPSSYGYEMCDRDIKITPGQMLQADSVEDLYLDPTDLKEKSWDEAALVGVYKVSGEDMVACTDQADANANGVLTIWDYSAKAPDGTTLVPYELRDGLLYVSPKLPLAEQYDHRVYTIIAPGIPNAFGGSVAVFDSYMGALPLDEMGTGEISYHPVEALSPQATVLNPSAAPGASVIRLYIYHPATGGTFINHILRLVTYRQPTTFR